MKASELITLIRSSIDMYGDQPVVIYAPMYEDEDLHVVNVVKGERGSSRVIELEAQILIA